MGEEGLLFIRLANGRSSRHAEEAAGYEKE